MLCTVSMMRHVLDDVNCLCEGSEIKKAKGKRTSDAQRRGSILVSKVAVEHLRRALCALAGLAHAGAAPGLCQRVAKHQQVETLRHARRLLASAIGLCQSYINSAPARSPSIQCLLHLNMVMFTWKAESGEEASMQRGCESMHASRMDWSMQG